MMHSAMMPAVPPAAAPAANDPVRARTWKAAQDFEALAINELLKPMFDTIKQPDTLFGGGEGEAAWQPMMVNELAKNIERAGGLGLAAPVYAQMLRSQDGANARTGGNG